MTLMPAQSGAASNSSEALIQKLADEALIVLGDSNLSKAERENGLKPLFDKYLDLPFMGRFVLGRHWRPLDSARRDRYTQAFVAHIRTVYAKRVETYTGEKIQVNGSKALNKKDTIVNSVLLRPSGPPIAVGWRVRATSDGRGKVIDVVVEGISLVISQREEFSSYLQNKTIDELIARLEAEAQP
jgi:phospholipid transport system substrate-binding protein